MVASAYKLAQVKTFGEFLYGTVDLIGASLDLASQMAVYAQNVCRLGSTADDIFIRGGSIITRKLGTTGLAVIGAILGAIDATLSYIDAGVAFSEGDIDRGWAHIVEGTGAVIMAVGAIVTIAAPPLGALIILIGVIIRLLGGIWAFFATDDERDKWLKHCLWGRHFHSEHDEQPDWALKPFLEWDDAPDTFSFVPEIYSENIPSNLYSWAEDIETQIKSFNRLIFNYTVDADFDLAKSKWYGYDLDFIALLKAEITVSSHLRNPRLLFTLRIKHPDNADDSPDNYSLLENQNVFEDTKAHIILENEQKKILFYWCDFSQNYTQEYREGEIRDAFGDEADAIIAHIRWIENLCEEIRSRFKLFTGHQVYYKTELTADNLQNDVFIKSGVDNI